MTSDFAIQASRHLPGVGALRMVALALVLLDLAQVGAQTLFYRPLLGQPGSLVYLIEPIALLVIYAALIVALTWEHSPTRQAMLQTGTLFGLAASILWLLNLTRETSANLSGIFSLLASAPLLLGGFVLWGIASFVRARQTNSMRAGLLSAVWSAMVCALLTITYGLALLFAAFPTLLASEANDPDFLRSGWRDLHAFVIANTFDATFTHLFDSLIIALIVGTLGAALGLIGRKRASVGG